jgi:NADPH:quinone reductase-like Zn-dependent oxidoreductase
MKASYLEQTGGPEVLKYGDRPDPVAGAGEIVVDIVAASVNAADWKVRAGGYGKAPMPRRSRSRRSWWERSLPRCRTSTPQLWR